MSYSRPNDPYIHSNASQYDERYQPGSYRDYPDNGSGYKETGGYGQGGGYGGANAATQAAATYSYAKPKKGVSKWVKIGVPIAILVIAGAVLGGIFGSRAANKSSGGSGNNGKGSADSSTSQDQPSSIDGNTQSASDAAAAAGGGDKLFYKGTDVYGNPAFVSSQIDSSAPSMSGKEVGNCASDPWTATNSVTNLRPHPRLWAPQYQWDCLPERIKNDAYLTVWNDTIFQNATAYAKMAPTSYVMDGDSGILDVSREIQLRVKAWAYAYKVSKDTSWVDRLYTELNTAAGNTNQNFGGNNNTERWNPGHFLDTAEMTAAFAFAYDWLYDVWTDDQKTMIRNAIVQSGLQPGIEQYSTDAGWWTKSNNGNGNWNCVCNGGLLTGALAVQGDDTTGVADSIIQNSIANFRENCMRGAYSDGTWSETPNYWYFGTNAHARAVSALITATGSDQGLMSANPNFVKTGDFHMYVSGNAGMFAYGDHGPNKFATTANQMMFYSKLANNPVYSLFQRDRADASSDPLSMFWYDTSVKGSFWNGLALDKFFDNDDGGQWASMRSSWTDFNGVYVGVKSSNATGHQTHGDLDAGDFVIDALGTRWAGELGSGNYLSYEYFTSEAPDAARWTYYRKGTQGQNTIILNNQNQAPNCLPINTFETTGAKQSASINYTPGTNDVAYFKTDMSSCYNMTSGNVLRGIRMLNGRRQVLVQDEIAGNSAITSIEWRVQTNGTVTLSQDRRTATLTISNITDPNAGVVGLQKFATTKTMVVKILSPSNAVFSTNGPPATREYGTAAVSSGGEDSDQVNTGVTALSIKLDGGSAQTIQVVWQPQWSELSTADTTDPKSVSLTQWSLTSHNQ
ncbi:hypothetical protein IE53DRAFT_371182 [Violaceomyces palustris]|uniref:Uncharacterized protein n=1 Tax=Violaceomyces palustris TaxID=1673888 RepID=A0ACD0NPT1_9BASI|nr:hypothetical protein IE53DRAFT_371182 [Violaceomyces palustris]